MSRTIEYTTTLFWDPGPDGTADVRKYSRNHTVMAGNKPPLAGSADSAFRGDNDRWNPEELLVASMAQCHMLWYLFLAAQEGVIVVGYEDNPHGTLEIDDNHIGRFTEITLHPTVTVKDESGASTAAALHEKAHEMCFVANSVNFPVHVDRTVHIAEPA